MQNLQTMLSASKLDLLRSKYEPAFMVKSNVEAIAAIAPRYVGWNEAVGATFYAPDAPVKPIDRERCLIALLTISGPEISLALHVYWGLMEGLSVEEIAHVAALAGCYGGLPRSMFGLQTIHRTLDALARIDEGDGSPPAVFRALAAELAKT